MLHSRRSMLRGTAATAILSMLPGAEALGDSRTRPIPSTGEAIPSIGLGSWITFNVGHDAALRQQCRSVIGAFVDAGGGMIDSSPMYGSSQDVIGDSLARLGRPDSVFSADKVWTSAKAGPRQIADTADLWGVERFDLLQVHNLVEWQAHLETLFAMQADGRLRYVGITTSHGARHVDLEAAMRRRTPDFVQLTYNIVDRAAERRLLPLARERGIAVICNRPFRRGWLPDRLAGKPLPSWAAEIGVVSWPQFLLKFIISHPAVTVAIPATRQVAHVIENKSAEIGVMPDAATRRRMAAYVGDL